jgi:hypothetical protein
MKYLICSLLILFILKSCPIYSQEIGNRKYEQNVPILIRPTNHDPNFRNFPEKSFYESHNNWQAVIDSTWGPGLPLTNKLFIFDQYTNAIRNQFDGFLSLGMDFTIWDSLKNHYRSQIDSSTSRGGFSAIMSHLARNLKDMHTHAFDEVVRSTALNPGIPVLMLSGYLTVEHFGAVLTALPDSTLLVLRVVPNHPLGLQPGDIILGYQGVPWKVLVHELLAAGLPFIPNGIGSTSADSDFLLLGAGMNWHLFDIMDIIQYSTGDTLHLPIAPMINLNAQPMLNNEQIEISNIPFPDYFNDELVSYGILNNTNIGYIYLFSEWPTATADQQFAQAVTALQNTEGLIIDLRLNFGGWALFDEAFAILFNDFNITIEDAYRSGQSTLTLSPSGNAYLYQIEGSPSSLYDHPIAVLLGPTCISMGDVTAQRFRYHPTVRFFGKPPGASLGDNRFIENFTDWYLRYSIGDMFHVISPNNYLNRQEFPIDYPVWHNPSDAAIGIDAVVEAALDWINNLVYGHDLTIEKKYYSPNTDTLHIQALLENPNSHPISSTVYIHNFDSTFIDSISLSKEMLTSEAEIWNGEGPAPSIEDHFGLSISTYDSVANQEFTIGNVDKFTTIGPVLYDGYLDFLIDPTPPLPKFGFKLVLRNNGQIAPANAVSAEIELYDTSLVKFVENNFQSFGAINPGEISVSLSYYVFYVDSVPNIIDFKYRLKVYSDGYLFWSQDSVDILVGIQHRHSQIPIEYSLDQNYPNPFNPNTTIEFDLPRASKATLVIYNILGEKVTTLVSDRLSAGSYSYEWDASGLASGVYLYRLQAGEYVETRKMILMQ